MVSALEGQIVRMEGFFCARDNTSDSRARAEGGKSKRGGRVRFSVAADGWPTYSYLIRAVSVSVASSDGRKGRDPM